ncbi:MAG: orotidine 5'-phosphate decarboxylase [Desulfomonile tiedjei]|nr:orotidine 5'-phosphate decarboxylase [Desulfomonile tiedjei]
MRDYAIVLAADLPTPEDVLSLVKRVGDVVDGVKVGEATLLQGGVAVLQRVRDLTHEKPLLVDLKIADIGFLADTGWHGTNGKIIKSLEDSGATHVTVHGFPGPLSVAEAVAKARESSIGVLLLPLMSHAGAKLFFSRPLVRDDVIDSALKGGLDVRFPEAASCKDVTDGILLLGEALGVEGYVGPATRPEELQRYRTITDRPIWCPGFGRQDRLGRSLGDQFREWAMIVGPRSAAIVGSTIFGAADPVAAAREVVSLRDSATENH